MLKKILLAGTALGFAAAMSFALPMPSAQAKPMTCHAYAKAKFPKKLMKRHKAFKACKAAYKHKMKKKKK